MISFGVSVLSLLSFFFIEIKFWPKVLLEEKQKWEILTLEILIRLWRIGAVEEEGERNLNSHLDMKLGFEELGALKKRVNGTWILNWVWDSYSI